jgi:asparagine synthase (glutamine-hydrolysing)
VTSGLLSSEALQRLVAEDSSGQEDRAKHLWHVLTLEYWYRGALEAGQSQFHGGLASTDIRA